MKQIAILILAVSIAAGCNHDATYEGPNGEKATVSQNGGTTTVTDDKGNTTTVSADGKGATYTDNKGTTASVGTSVSEADLGLPFYPGSTDKPSESMSATEAGVTTVMSGRCVPPR